MQREADANLILELARLGEQLCGLLWDAVTGNFAVMLFVACIAVFRAGECMRAMEK